MKNDEIIAEIIRCGQTLSAHGLVWGHSGNISIRTEPNLFLISGSGTNLGNLSENDLVLCKIENDNWTGSRQPSMETGLHQGIYHSCDEAAVAIHSQPFYSTMVACSDMEIRTDFLPEAMAYLRNIQRVPYHHAGSKALAEATAEKAKTSKTLILNNHGVVCWGSSPDEALLLTETIEFLCRLLVTSRIGSIQFNYLGQDVMQDFIEHLHGIGY